ncbi:methylenetetrahydrofolate reductase C-terminal domain-containing protein [Acinetobacter sp. ULE_I057]|uniref:methylenetetrahydrofolate reductase C-terminal domain-containing protein n=1 Tax=Acinetobacter sp. ULE_I057 TaxID=3373070 RepID=UPI003AF7FFF0
MSQLSQYFAQNKFCCLVEYLPSMQEVLPVATQLAGFPVCMTLSDRVRSDDDIAPLIAAQSYPQQIEKVLHYAGKGRDIHDFNLFLTQAKQHGQQNLLLLTGDKLKRHHDGQGSHARTRYLESVNAVIAAKQQGGFHIGVALNPFKYSQAEKQAQYLKLHKKLQAGADYIITQLGFDLVALKQAHEFLIEENYTQKILACVMPLTLARAKFMLKHNVAGIVITPHMLEVLAQEHDSDQTENTYLRCALQILICQHIGYAGVHLSACHKADEQAILTSYIEQYRHLDLKQCEQLWTQLWQLKTGNELRPAAVEKSKLSNLHQKVKYQFLDTIHSTMFNSSLVKGLGAYIFSAGFWNKALAAKLLLQAEYLSKHFIVGCESCGQCRLAETLYICPETCPKGLANGPCGGTHLDRCEFGDRECIHSVKARLAEEVDQIQILKKQLIPTVPIEVRGTSSWKNWYVKQ